MAHKKAVEQVAAPIAPSVYSLDVPHTKTTSVATDGHINADEYQNGSYNDEGQEGEKAAAVTRQAQLAIARSEVPIGTDSTVGAALTWSTHHR